MAARLLLLLALLPLVSFSQELLVAAASDLTPLETPLHQSFEAASSVKLRFTFGSSGMLARQIRSGAPFDVYLSANEQFVRELAKEGLLLPGSVHAYATGRVGLWSQSGRIRSVKDLAGAGVRQIAIPNPQHAPYGVAAEQILLQAGVLDQVRGKLVLAENVRQAFEYARTGNADAVLTSWTLLFDKGGILLPDSGHASIRQAGGVIQGTKNEQAGRAFLAFLAGAEGRKLLARFGLFAPQP
ncbi:MAG TPA: molybdate ABC transporter substrate-binding protein [Paludibaculum sp.]|jgi:molybdate transport system substrate-binding protein